MPTGAAVVPAISTVIRHTSTTTVSEIPVAAVNPSWLLWPTVSTGTTSFGRVALVRAHVRTVGYPKDGGGKLMPDNIFNVDLHLGHDSHRGLSAHRWGFGGAAVEGIGSGGWSPKHRRRELSA
jgi:hypothetical protein